MCTPARCSRCSKTTWQGCGAHVDEVMASVPDVERCLCEAAPRVSLLDRLRTR